MPKKENGNFTEAELRAFTGEVPVASESKKQTELSGLSPVTIRSTVASPLAEATGDEQGEESLFSAVREDAELSPTSVPSPTSDTSSNLLCQCHRLFGISHVYIQKMSRWVRCSYGKRAGFVDAKIDIISESSKFLNFFACFRLKSGFTSLVKGNFYSFPLRNDINS